MCFCVVQHGIQAKWEALEKLLLLGRNILVCIPPASLLLGQSKSANFLPWFVSVRFVLLLEQINLVIFICVHHHNDRFLNIAALTELMLVMVRKSYRQVASVEV